MAMRHSGPDPGADSLEDWAWVDGAAYSRRFGDIFHTRAGALAQAEAVFLRGVGLPERWQGRRSFAILENGFGFGVNALVTVAAWLADPQRSATLDYVAIDAFPRSAAAMETFWGAVAPDFLKGLVQEVLAQYPHPIPGFHRLWLCEGRVRLTLVWLPADRAAQQIVGIFDALYLDGFAPAKNPEMWSEPLIAALVRRLAPQGRVATWSTAGSVRRALASAGLTVVRQPGFGSKRERLEAFRGPYGPAPAEVPRTVAVVGAGLAGGAAALALSERGIAVTLFEAQRQPANGASGNPAGAARWLPSRDDNLLSQWTRSGLLHLRRRWPRWAELGARGEWSGAVQLARSNSDAARMAETVTRLPWLKPHLDYLDCTAASERIGVPVARGGWWFPDGGWVAPQSLVASWLAAARPLVAETLTAVVTKIAEKDGGWQLMWRDPTGYEQHRTFDAVVLATGAGATPLWADSTLSWGSEPVRPGPRLPITPVRGQVSWQPATSLLALSRVVTGSGYAIPVTATGGLLFGASSHAGDWSASLRSSDHLANRVRLAAMVPQAVELPAAPWSGRVSWRSATHDHLPVVGALALNGRWDDPKRWRTQLWVINGLGSRGIAMAMLAAELFASYLCHEPLPVSRQMATAVDPARFARRTDLLYSANFDD